ncbi:MAG: histidine phosphatase family protein [Candidatus Omnitrophica bacterium]|nr:histidine phosphatase family protein [Candidatus Omnitrophota bacterium]
MSTKLILIRHGATEWNLKRRYCGMADIKLSDKGKRQAMFLAKRLRKEKIDKIYASDRRRARETARIIFKGRDIEEVPALREISFGSFEGLTYAQIMRKNPEIYRRWLKNPFSVTIPGGESLSYLKKRTAKAFKKIISNNPDKRVAVVCHGGVISIFMNQILKTKKFWEQIPSPASVNILEYKNNKPRILAFNDTAHLEGGTANG